jgi:hypothetical protein
MNHYVECRSRKLENEIFVTRFSGFNGLSRDIAQEVFERECKNGHDAVYLCKLSRGCDVTIKAWYKEATA